MNVQQSSSVLKLMQGRADEFASRDAFRIKEHGLWRSMTFAQLAKGVVKISSWLIEQGILRGDRIAILSESKPEWALAFFASIRSGATVVPLDIKLTETELLSILSDCQPAVLFCDSKHLDIASSLIKEIDSIRKIVVIDGQIDEIDQAEQNEHNSEIEKERRAICFLTHLDQINLHSGLERDDNEIAVLVYTSGTTGNPKGVMTTFGNLLFQINSFQELIQLGESDRFLSILPLNHLLELTGGFLGILNLGGTVCFCHSLFPQEILKAFKEQEITGMVAVPLFLKSLKNGIEREIKRKGEDALEQFRKSLEKVKTLSIAQKRQVLTPVLSELGGKLRVIVSGGAPLEIEVAEFFDNIGIPVLQGYGLTETSPVISGNGLGANKLGSVGKPLKNLEVKIDTKAENDSEGEILTRGPHVMAGYYKRKDLTDEAIDSEGWFHTGDLGKIDEDGYLYITGRIKNMIVLAGGKKIFPEEVEAAFGQATKVKEVCVLSHKHKDGFKEGSEEVACVAVPSDSLIKALADDHKLILQEIKTELDSLAQNLAPYKRPTKYFIRVEDLPKTATRKIKRQVVSNWLNEQKQE